MRALRVLITADIHFERLQQDMTDKYTDYFIGSLDSTDADVFILAGDVTDSRNMKAESNEYKKLTKMLISISKKCDLLGVKFYALRGTPSHDGRVVENIIKINKLNITYIPDPTVYYINGYKVLFLPEIYTDTYESFETLVSDTLGGEMADMCVFHGMFDFPIPALRQIDSSFNQSRTVVIDNVSFMNKFVKRVAIGGHVHSFMKCNDVVYTGRFINEIHQPHDKEDFGIKLLILDDTRYEVHTVSNPHLHMYEFVHLSFNENTLLDDILTEVGIVDTAKVMFTCSILNNHTSRETYKSFIKVVKPIHVKRKMVSTSVVDETVILSRAGNAALDIQDIDHMLKELYKEETGKDLSEEVLDSIKNFE